ncbi:hypothetical protein BV25DRAFT_1911524 [Artomyces pyxidatus]|uniref:Uncharacterized protein n=1 Tax=Artomyces pyxidatus TaxID=48021 RepID=A0ACB8TGU8_9AGAM|nr:hypothetical protein BV25DRAFT_1911524 [Artomyces pyxidatus]
MTTSLRRMKSVHSAYERLATIITLVRRSTQKSGKLNNKPKSASIAATRPSVSFLLPDELLSYIILEYAFAMDVSSRKWAPILLVCRRWHDVARARAQLWSYVSDLQSTERCLELIKRSGEYPPTCNFALPHSLFNLLNAGGHARRVRSLRIPDSFDEDVMQKMNDFSMLEALHMSMLGQPDETVHLTLLDAFFDGRAPCLHRIALRGALSTIWTALSNLTVLSLAHYGHSHRLSFQNLLSILQQSPRLRELTLRSCLRATDVRDALITLDMRSESLSLSHLERLDVSAGWCLTVEALLTCIVLPPTAFLYVRIYNAKPSGIEKLLLQVRQHLRKPGSPVLRAINIGGGPHRTHRVLLSVSAGTTRIPDTSTSNPLTEESVRISLSPYRPYFRESIARALFTKILDALPLEHVADLVTLGARSVQSRHTFSSTTWGVVFCHIPRLETARSGFREGMAEVVKGLFDTVQRSAYGLGGKRRRRASQGLNVRPFLTSQDWPTTDALYDQLWGLLVVYREMGTSFKPAGVA